MVTRDDVAYRLSSHAAIIPLENGAVVFHSYTGRAMRVGTRVVDLLKALRSPQCLPQVAASMGASPEEIAAALHPLLERGVVINDTDADSAMDNHDLLRYPERVLRLYLTRACNMACTYCFEQNVHADGYMSSETAIAAAKAFRKWLCGVGGGSYSRVKVNFFGGEPLLRFALLKEVVGPIRAILSEENDRLSLTLNTNGTLLSEEIAAWCVANDMHVLISVDGTKPSHDATRRYPDGRGSYEDVVAGLRALMSASPEGFRRTNVSVLCTVTSQNIGAMRDLANSMRELGVLNLSFNPAFACIHGSGPEQWTALQETEIGEFIQNALDLQAEMMPYDLHVGGSWGYIPQRLREGGVVYCQAIGYEIGVAANRTLFPCPCTYGKPAYAIGQLSDDSEFCFNAEYPKWRSRTVLQLDRCRECDIACVCRGGCPGVNVLTGRDILQESQCAYWRRFVHEYLQRVNTRR